MNLRISIVGGCLFQKEIYSGSRTKGNTGAMKAGILAGYEVVDVLRRAY